jgi:hypothetical protein
MEATQTSSPFAVFIQESGFAEIWKVEALQARGRGIATIDGPGATPLDPSLFIFFCRPRFVSRDGPGVKKS